MNFDFSPPYMLILIIFCSFYFKQRIKPHKFVYNLCKMYNQTNNQSRINYWLNWQNFANSTKLCKLEKTKKHIHYTELYFRIDINSLCQSTLSLVSSQTPKLCKLGWVWNPRQPIMLSTHQQQSEPRKLPPLLSTFYGTVVFQINCSFQFSLTFIGMLLAYKDSTDMYCTNCIYILGPDYFTFICQ